MTIKTSIKAGPRHEFGHGIANHNETQTAERTRSLKVKSGVKAGGYRWNHNETEASERTRSLTVKSGIKAGDPGRIFNHNETQAVGRTRSLKVKSGVKAGPHEMGHLMGSRNHNETQVRGFNVKSGVKAGPLYKSTDVTLKRGVI